MFTVSRLYVDLSFFRTPAKSSWLGSRQKAQSSGMFSDSFNLAIFTDAVPISRPTENFSLPALFFIFENIFILRRQLIAQMIADEKMQVVSIKLLPGDYLLGQKFYFAQRVGYLPDIVMYGYVPPQFGVNGGAALRHNAAVRSYVPGHRQLADHINDAVKIYR